MSVEHWASKTLPEPILSVLRPLHSRGKELQKRAMIMGDRLKIIGPESIYSNNYYAKRRTDPWRSDAHHIADALDKYFSPDSVIDFGCAVGAYLEPFHNRGVAIKGIDGNPAAIKNAVVPKTHLDQYDLREPYNSEKTYDLVICFEVAEHLPEKFANILVDTLANAGDAVVFTAAKPGQGGDHHVNEQPRKYWIDKFESRGMTYDSNAVDDLRTSIEPEKMTWVPENLMVFCATKD